MAIDLSRCFGCQTCAAACKIANNLPKGLNYNVVYTVTSGDTKTINGTAVARGALANDSAGGSYPNCKLDFLPVNCQHCASPACLAVCPTGATRQDENGIVTVDSDTCIGCESCIKACPYDGVRTLIGANTEYYLDVVVGEADAPAHKVATVEKCTFCKNLVERGEKPACMQLCPGRARYWGDLDDPNSEVSLAIKSKTVQMLEEQGGTEPQVYYLV
jgi:molybdopterin-containing oxidoreductase family iron-sulfur binding subunit